MSRHHLALTLLFAQALGGQKPAAAAPAAMTLCRLQVAGPLAWRDQLQPTNFGVLLATAEGEQLWGPTVARVDALLQQFHGSAAAAARERWLGFAGALCVELRGVPGRFDGDRAQLSAELTLLGDGRSDLPAIAADLQPWLPWCLGAEAVQQGELHLWSMPLQLPRAADGRLALQRREPAAAGRRAAPLLRVELDLPAVAELFCRRDENSARLRTLFGSARTLSFELGHDGPRVLATARLTFDGDDRGLAAGLWPPGLGAPRWDWLPARDALAVATGRADALATVHCLRRCEAILRDCTVEQVEQVQDAWLGVSLTKDLWPHVGDEVALVWLPPRGRRTSGLLDGAVLCVQLRDQPAFDATLAKVLSRFTSITFHVDGDVVFAAWPGLITAQLAVGHGYAFLTLDEDRTGLEALLEAAANAPAVPPPDAPGADGVQGRGRSAVVDLIGGRIGSLAMFARSLFGARLHLPRPRAFQDAVAPWLPLLTRQQLDHADTQCQVTLKEVRWQVRW